ncbi:signal peptidase I [Kitasatospora sp. NPDC093550]|uniref:signal peptidase I n=1 Tax=Kitasatospora sp. NPDC093550 TaxID=3364089 RepID=UPI00380AE473
MPKRRGWGLWVPAVTGVVGLLCAALGLAVVLTGGYSVHRMAGDTMRPGLRPGDRMLSDRMLSDRVAAGDVRRGEIYLVDSPWMLDHPVVSRVVALGGDRLVCAGGRLTLNGEPPDEPAARLADSCYADFDVTVPPGRAFLMGDQRAHAVDSRLTAQSGQQGTVELAKLTGGRVVWHSGPGTPALPGKLVGAVLLLSLGAVLGLGGLVGAVVTATRRRTA